MSQTKMRVSAGLIAAIFAFSAVAPAAAQDAVPPASAQKEAEQPATPPVAAPNEADRLAAARDLLQAANIDAQFAAIVPMMFAQMKQSRMPSDPKMKEEMDKVFAEVEKLFVARRSEVLDQIAALYAQKFSAEEMKALADFYRSPVGQKFITAMPELVAEAMTLGNAWGRRIALDAERKVREELRKRGIAL